VSSPGMWPRVVLMKSASPGVVGPVLAQQSNGIHAALDVVVVVGNDADAGALPLLPKVTSFIVSRSQINNNRCYVDHTSNIHRWSTYPYLVWPC
jgi:hypothetical protein